MALTGFHLRVAQLLSHATEGEGFALGGGYGLQTHDLTDRPSKDLDFYVDRFDPAVFERAERALIALVEADGLTARVVKQEDVFRAILVTGEDGEQVVVDLGYDYRENPPVRVKGIGPVLDIEDIVTGKVRALLERGAERDYSDIDNILSSGRWTPADLLAKGQTVFPDTTAASFAARLVRADRLDPEIYAAIGIRAVELFAMQERLSAAAQKLTTER